MTATPLPSQSTPPVGETSLASGGSGEAPGWEHLTSFVYSVNLLHLSLYNAHHM